MMRLFALGIVLLILRPTQMVAGTTRYRMPRYSIRDLGDLPGQERSSANGINNKGQIVGASSGPMFDREHAVLWDNGKITDLTARGLPGTAEGINDRGQIVGYVKRIKKKGETVYAYLWIEGRARRLQRLPGESSQAFDINNAGSVIGVAGHSAGGVVSGDLFLWRAGRVTPLRVHTNDTNEFSALNNKGEVAGTRANETLDSPSYRSRVFLWKRGRVRRWLSLGGKVSYARGINDVGWVVGETDLGRRDEAGDALYSAALWKDGKAYNLNRLIPPHSHWDLQEATGINNRGQIVGTGIHRGKDRAFLLTPVR